MPVQVVDGVLQRCRDRVVVLGSGKDDAVGATDGLGKGGHVGRQAVGLDVLREDRKARNVGDFNLRTVLSTNAGEVAEERRVGGGSAEGAGDGNKAERGSHCSVRCVVKSLVWSVVNVCVAVLRGKIDGDFANSKPKITSAGGESAS